MFGRFRTARRDEGIATRLYGAIVTQGREPALFADLGAPDTIDGRFDMLVLHAVLVMARLNHEGEPGRELAQEIFDLFCRDMDRTLREMGVGDLTVPKRMKKMGESFYGRMGAYVPALETSDEAGLAEAIGRNVFPEGGEAPAKMLARYALASAEALRATGFAELQAGGPRFADAKTFASEGVGA